MAFADRDRRYANSAIRFPAGVGAPFIPGMAGYVDIHAHILPGIDDGPEDLEGSLSMARAPRGPGITTLVATPHLRADFPNVHIHELADRCRALQQAIHREQIPLRIVSGTEVALVWALDADDEELR